MALINCPECGQPISDTTNVCIHCGYKLKADSLEDSSSLVQQVELTSIRVKSSKKIILVLCITLALATISFFTCYMVHTRNIAKEKNTYKTNMESLLSQGILSSVEIESYCNNLKSVWYNCIYEKSDSTTDKYTKSSNYSFYSDFNNALLNYTNDSTNKSIISSIETSTNKIRDIYNSLKAVPSGYDEYYKLCTDYFNSYVSFSMLATDPNGSLTSYSDAFAKADTDILTKYNALKDDVDYLESNHN